MYNDKINKFSLLTKEEQIEKILSMLEIFKWWNNIFSDIFELINSTKDDIWEKFIIKIYEIIIKTIENITNDNIWESINELQLIKEKFLIIKKQEEQEKKAEVEEANNILNQL